LKHLRKLAEDFPKLKIVLEHATTKEAVECVSRRMIQSHWPDTDRSLSILQVKSLPDNVACTITAHHLLLTIDSVPAQPFHFCKPIAKEPVDRAALQEVVASGHPRFFLGSDSAPHPIVNKIPKMPSSYLSHEVGPIEGNGPQPCAAGVYTSPILLPLLANTFEKLGALDKLAGFASTNGRAFYGMQREGDSVKLRRVENGGKVPAFYKSAERGVDVVPFMAGEALGWEIVA
jgi:dihydroorotase